MAIKSNYTYTIYPSNFTSKNLSSCNFTYVKIICLHVLTYVKMQILGDILCITVYNRNNIIVMKSS